MASRHLDQNEETPLMVILYHNKQLCKKSELKSKKWKTELNSAKGFSAINASKLQLLGERRFGIRGIPTIRADGGPETASFSDAIEQANRSEFGHGLESAPAYPTGSEDDALFVVWNGVDLARRKRAKAIVFPSFVCSVVL